MFLNYTKIHLNHPDDNLAPRK